MKFILSIFIPIFIIFGFIIPTFRVWRSSRVNPIVLSNNDSAYGYIGKIFKLILVSVIVNIVLFIGWNDWIDYSIVLYNTQNLILISYFGIVLISIAFVIIVTAQSNMLNSWRVGIDLENETELITKGLFKFSRNPIFLGILFLLFGLLLIIPNIIMFISFFVGFVIIQIQVRLEEEYLSASHPKEYIKYRGKVKRWI